VCVTLYCVYLNGSVDTDLAGVYTSMVPLTQTSYVCIPHWPVNTDLTGIISGPVKAGIICRCVCTPQWAH